MKCSDIKKFIKKLKDSGVGITRKTKFSHCFYDAAYSLIVIPKKVRHVPIENPVICLFHEGGHALEALNKPQLLSSTLKVKESLERFRSSLRYSKVMAQLLDFVNHPDNLNTLNSENIEILESYRKLRYTLFLELRANSRALKHIPEYFKQEYITIASIEFAKYRKILIKCQHIDSRNYFKNLLKISEICYFKDRNDSLQT